MKKIKLTQAGRIETHDKAVKAFLEQPVRVLKARVKSLGAAIYQGELQELTEKAERAIKELGIPAEYFAWSTNAELSIVFDGYTHTAHYLAVGQDSPKLDLNIRKLFMCKNNFGKIYGQVVPDKLPTPRAYVTAPRSSKVIIVPSDHPYAISYMEILKDTQRLETETLAFGESIWVVLQSATTLDQLEELSPELAKFYPKPEPKPTTALVPVETVNQVNKTLHKIKKVAA